MLSLTTVARPPPTVALASSQVGQADGLSILLVESCKTVRCGEKVEKKLLRSRPFQGAEARSSEYLSCLQGMIKLAHETCPRSRAGPSASLEKVRRTGLGKAVHHLKKSGPQRPTLFSQRLRKKCFRAEAGLCAPQLVHLESNVPQLISMLHIVSEQSCNA